jgi:hypothetical protein
MPGCGRPAESRGKCAVHRRTTTQRGYGQRHRELRASLAPEVEAGGAICWRCGELIGLYAAKRGRRPRSGVGV